MVSTDSSEERRRSRKRKHKSAKRRERKSKRGELSSSTLPVPTFSDSTIYTRGCKSPQNVVMEESDDASLDGGGVQSDANTEDFIDSINSSRNYSTPSAGERNRSGSPRRDTGDGRPRGERTSPRDRERALLNEQYKDRADSVIRDLHQNKADLAKPSGELSQFVLLSLVRDFKHFHLTSHVDKKLKERIKDQDFTVDFRRLLPKSRSKNRYDQRMQVVHEEGSTFFVPAGEKDVKEINGYKTWETAFKVFMGLFNQFWPERMQELLQYSHIIQTASQNHPWENVFNYDISFREIMTEQPNTHWGVISQQTWTLELGEHSYKSYGEPSRVGPNHQQSKPMNEARRTCWRFNKGRCTFGDSCEYDHRCSHCGKRGHGRHECFKRGKQDKAAGSGRAKNNKN